MTGHDSTTAIDAFRVTMDHTRDVSGLVEAVRDGRLRPDDVVAVTGKTEGWGSGYDASRIDAGHAVREFLLDRGTRSADQIDRIPLVFSAGVGTILSPHLVLFTRSPAEPAPDGAPRLALGTALSESMLPEWVGTTRAVEANADAVRRASEDAGLRADEIEYVVGKAYYPTQEAMAAARDAGRLSTDYDEQTMFRLGSGSAALGVAVAADGLGTLDDSDIGTRSELWSAKLAVSTNPAEDVGDAGPRTQLLALGNRAGMGGRLRVGHAEVRDLLDVDAVPRALRRAGVEVGHGPLTPDVSARVVAVYMKINEQVSDRLRGRRQVIEDPSYGGSLKTVVASAFSAMLQDTLIWISGGGVQQGPPGGGTLAIVVDVG